MTRKETYKPIKIIHGEDLFEGQETQGNQILPPTQLLGYIYESEYSTSVLLNPT